MKRFTCLIAILCSLWILPSAILAQQSGGAVSPQTPAAKGDDLQTQIASLKLELQKLRGDVAALKKENQELRRQLALQKPLPDSFNDQPVSAQAPQAQPQVQPRVPTAAAAGDQQDTGYWMTNSSGKRHNRNCRYYKNSNGHPSGPGDGIPCKICGG